MKLTDDQELLEHELRVKMMQTNIDQGRLNMDKLRSDLKWENRKFLVQFLLAIAASVGAGVALANYVNSRPPLPAPPAPPPQIIYLVPGQAPPPAH